MGSLSSSAIVSDGQRRNVANKPVEVALNEIVTRARVFTDAGGAAIALRDGDEIVTRASSGNIAPDVGTRMSIEGSLTGQALLKGAPVHVEDSDKDPRVDAAICRAMNTRSFIITPIAGSTTMLGVLAVFAPTPNAFTRTDLAVLRTMADQISAAVGGGAFLQHAWPVATVEQQQVEEIPADWQPPNTSAEEVHQTALTESNSVEPAPDKPVLADVHFMSVKEPEPIEVEPAPPSVISAAIEVAPPAKKVEPDSRAEEVEPVAQPVEPMIVPTVAPVPPAHSASVSTAPAVSQSSESSGARKRAEAKAQVKPDRTQVKVQAKECVPSQTIAAEPGVVSLADIVDEPAKPIPPIAPRKVKAVPVKATAAAAPAAAAPKEQIAWKGLTVDAVADRRPIGRIVAGIAAAVVIVVAITGGMALHKPSRTQASVTTTPVPVETSSAIAPGIAPEATPPAVASSRLAATASTPAAPKVESKQPATEANVKPAQPAIVLAPSASSGRQAVVEDQAPPQLAFAGEKPKLLDTAAVPAVAAPKRIAAAPVTAELIRKVAPTYPEMARRLHQKGSIVLQAEVMKDGTVGKIDVVSGAALFRPAAVNAVKQWRYKPAQLGGAPVASSVTVVVNFDAPSDQQ